MLSLKCTSNSQTNFFSLHLSLGLQDIIRHC